MAKVNLKKFSIPELEELQVEIEQTIDQRREENRIAVKEKMEAMAAEAGFSIDELYGKSKGKKPAPATQIPQPRKSLPDLFRQRP